MNSAEFIAALELPVAARVDQRVPKKMLLENGAPTTADRRRITQGIDEVHWIAALKPATVGVPEFRNATREYLEIAVLSAAFRPDALAPRLTELLHRAVPYPLVLVVSHGDAVTLSLCHKRRSEGEAGATVLDGTLTALTADSSFSAENISRFLAAMAVGRQPRGSMYALYQGWMNTAVSLLVTPLTGTFVLPASQGQAQARQGALAECARLEKYIASLRSEAVRETQVPQLVDLNLALKRAQAEYSAARALL